MKFLRSIALFATIGVCLHSKAYNIRQISSRDGLSNSAIICMFQDKERYLWAGTYDGLNKYNGTDIDIYKPDIRNQSSLSGNVIRKMVESKDGYLWILTKGGLNKYSKKKGGVEAYFDQFREDCSIACDSRGNVFILTQTGSLFHYNRTKQEFKEITVPGFKPKRNWSNLTIDSYDTVWITNDGEIRQYAINHLDNCDLSLEWTGHFDHHQYITHIYYDKGSLIIVDRNGDLFLIKSNEKIFIRNIRPAIAKYGDITSILFDNSDAIIGFRTSGVIRLNHKKEYEIQEFPINCGVFCLLKDDVQDILWVGTDGQGIYACTHDKYELNGINLKELPLKTQKPVRAIFSDHLGDLWLGTKGNGIIKIKGYENASEYNRGNVEHLSVENGLSDNAVFAFEKSRRKNILWIASGGPGLNYYSYSDKKIHTLKNNSPVSFVEMHSLMETSDTTLWVASLFSLLKIDIHQTGNSLETRRVHLYDFNIKDKQRFNQIYSICQQNDSIIWLAMRGNGAIRFNLDNETYRLITFDDNGIAPMNDILSIYINRGSDLWFGSSYGINHLKESADGGFQSRNYSENDGLSNNTIHGILEGSNGTLWLSSNRGITLFDPEKKTFRHFNQKTGLKVIEFSDNAYYKHEESSTYFFGGIDGVVWIRNAEREKSNYIPPVSFTKLRILNEETNLNDFIVNKNGKNFLQLKYNQNFFTVSFSANEFIESANIRFSYMLESFNEVWMNADSREAQFTNIPPGKYLLKARYSNGLDKESPVATLNIEILPPWYLNLYAKAFYCLAVAYMIFFIYMYLKRRYERKKKKISHQLNQKYKEEMYENKLRFFTNITHEFCTPLTLIRTPSERILNHEGSDLYVKKCAHVIKSNAERLNNLIQEIIDFRRMETGNKTCMIERCDVNAICNEIMSAFTDLAEENNISFSLNISSVILWNTDRDCMATILNNLISNAFKYTTANGIINITVYVENNELVLKVYNSGKGIREEDISYIFNRYSVLDNVKQNSIKGLSSRNGLGLAICKSMVELLEGTIEVKSLVNQYAEFVVKLPACNLSKQESGKVSVRSSYGVPNTEEQINDPDINKTNKAFSQDPDKPLTILVVDDNEDMLWMLKDILSGDYTVLTAKDGNEGLQQLTHRMPELIITDIMMPNRDGISMTKQIKSNPYTMHIPLIIISAKSAMNDKIEGIESGADAYIPKPFEAQYLRSVARQLIEKHKKLREYYNSSASSVDYLKGQLLSKGDRDLIQSAIHITDQRIGDIDFSPEDLANELHFSLRSLYRKFKDLGLPTPKDFIKNQRIEYSAKLLLSTALTIQEIMYKTGFTTRSHFYKEFTKRYKLSPKEYREGKNIEPDAPDENDHSPHGLKS